MEIGMKIGFSSRKMEKREKKYKKRQNKRGACLQKVMEVGGNGNERQQCCFLPSCH